MKHISEIIKRMREMIECHDCKIPLDSDKAYFDPIKVDKWVRCLDCHKSIREAIEVTMAESK